MDRAGAPDGTCPARVSKPGDGAVAARGPGHSDNGVRPGGLGCVLSFSVADVFLCLSSFAFHLNLQLLFQVGPNPWDY